MATVGAVGAGAEAMAPVMVVVARVEVATGLVEVVVAGSEVELAEEVVAAAMALEATVPPQSTVFHNYCTWCPARSQSKCLSSVHHARRLRNNRYIEAAAHNNRCSHSAKS